MTEETVLSGTTQTPPIPHYYHYDGNGNVITTTDATGGTEGRYRHTAFAEPPIRKPPPEKTLIVAKTSAEARNALI
jgi:YD repeat-containing protein